MTEKKPLTKAQQEFLNRSAEQDLPKVIRDWKPSKESSKKTSKAATAYGKARGVISRDFSEAQEKSRRAHKELSSKIDRMIKRNEELKGKIDSKKVDKLLKDTYKDVLNPTTKDKKSYTEKILKGLRKAGIKIGLAGLTGPVGLLAAGISEAAAATPAGDPSEEAKLRRAEKALGRRKRAGQRGAPGASKKKYAKGGVAKGFKGHF